LYAVTNRTVFRSFDHGATWQLRAALPSTSTAWVRDILVDPTDANTLVVQGAEPGLFISRNGGDTWSSVPLPQQIIALAFTKSTPVRLWAATPNGLYVSSNYGTNWSLTTMTQSTSSVATHPVDRNILYVGTFGTLWRSVDEALSWTDVSGSAHFGEVSTIAISPSAPGLLMTGGVEGAWSSPDSGVTWSKRNDGLIGGRTAAVTASSGAGNIYVAPGAGVIYKFAAGSTSAMPLNEAVLRAQYPNPNFMGGFSSILAQALNPDRLLVGTSHFLLRSLDGGASWSQIGLSAFGGGQVYTLADSPGDEQIVLAGTLSGIYRSADGGATWSSTSGLPAGATHNHIAMGLKHAYATVMTPSNIIGASPDGHGVYKSIDHGISWVPANTGIENLRTDSIAIAAGNDEIVYVGSAQGIIKTTNAGATWSNVQWLSGPPFTSTYRVATDPVNPSIVYAAVANAIGRSVDGGNTWEALRTPSDGPMWLPSLLLVDPQHPEALFVGTFQHGLQHISIQPDLSLQLNGLASAVAYGSAVSYRYTVSNLGPFHATNTRFVGHLPAGVQSITAEFVGTPGVCTVSALTVTCVLDVLRAGFSSDVMLTFVQPTAGTATITASVIGDQPDAAVSNNAVSAYLTAVAMSDLSASVSGRTSANDNESLTYTLNVTNSGPHAAGNVLARWQVPIGAAVTTITSERGTCTHNDGSIVCQLGSIDAAASASVVVHVAAAAPNSYQHAVSVTSDNHDPVPGNNMGTASTIVAAVGSPQPSQPVPPPGSGPPAAASASTNGGGGGSQSMISVLLFALCAVFRGLAKRKLRR
jgi:uncharacterized repeat protein (TIGR01451 family)